LRIEIGSKELENKIIKAVRRDDFSKVDISIEGFEEKVQNILNEIQKDLKSKNFNYNVTGSNYGLVTNAIHYLDYASWLSGTTDYSLDFSQLDTKVVESKRKGYLELNGTLRANFKSGAVASVTCFAKGSLPIVVEVRMKHWPRPPLRHRRPLLLFRLQALTAPASRGEHVKTRFISCSNRGVVTFLDFLALIFALAIFFFFLPPESSLSSSSASCFSCKGKNVFRTVMGWSQTK
jgi:hypothetical protein